MRWLGLILLIVVCVTLLSVIIVIAIRPKPTSQFTNDQLLKFIEENSRAVKNSKTTQNGQIQTTECQEACEELWERDQTKFCASDFCSAMDDRCNPKCNLEDKDTFKFCSEDELLGYVKSNSCPTYNSANCAQACTQLRVKNSNEVCEVDICASSEDYRQTNDGYCCNFPNVEYCKDASAMLKAIETDCTATPSQDNVPLCQDACTTIGTMESYDPKGDRTKSTGACNNIYCYLTLSEKGKSCYQCKIDDRELCTNEDLVNVINDECPI